LPPRLDPTKSAPLILSFHGAGANPKGWATLSKFNEQGGPLGFVIAYPAGYKGFWHAGDDCCGPPLNENIDDVAFVRAVIDDVAAIIKVDPDRIFAAGFSNGGRMAYRLACELSDRIAAIAVAGSSLGMLDCHPKRPVPLLAFHGTADTFSPYLGGTGTATPFRIEQVGAPKTAQRWAELNGCQTANTKVTF